MPLRGSIFPVKFSDGGIYVVELPDRKIIAVDAKCFRRAEVLFQLPGVFIGFMAGRLSLFIWMYGIMKFHW